MISKLLMLVRNKMVPQIRFFLDKILSRISNSKKPSAKRIAILSISLLVLLFAVFLTLSERAPDKNSPIELTYKEFMKFVDSGKVYSIIDYTKDSKKILGKMKTDYHLFITDNPQSDDLKKQLLEKDIRLEDKTMVDTIPDMLKRVFNVLLPLALFVIVFLFIMKQTVKSQYSNKDTKFEVIKKCTLTFDDVAGNEEAKENMSELVDFLVHPETFTKVGVVPPKGTVLYGPPGTGKTLLAKALAGTADVPFIAVSGSDFVEKFVGVGASRIRVLFELARKMSPCIVFIDEIDALGKRSSSEGGSSDERDRTINQILVEIDGFSGSEGIIIIAATNRLDMLDPALLRSGRFDRQIQVGLPDIDARYSILKLHTKNKPLSDNVDLKEVAKMTVYMSGADLANVMNEAGIYAVRNRHTTITMKDIDKAISKIHAGEEKKNKKNITLKDKEITAFHEAGHALAAKLISGKTISKVTIIPTTKGAGGYTLYLPDEKMFATKRELLNEIAMFLGGRAAEELIYGENNVTNGASSDIKRATQIACDMVQHFGMSQMVGLVSFQEVSRDSVGGGNSLLVEKEVKSIIEDVYKETKLLLQNNIDCLNHIASELLKKETIYRKDVDNIIEDTMFHRTLS